MQRIFLPEPDVMPVVMELIVIDGVVEVTDGGTVPLVTTVVAVDSV